MSSKVCGSLRPMDSLLRVPEAKRAAMCYPWVTASGPVRAIDPLAASVTDGYGNERTDEKLESTMITSRGRSDTGP